MSPRCSRGPREQVERRCVVPPVQEEEDKKRMRKRKRDSLSSPPPTSLGIASRVFKIPNIPHHLVPSRITQPSAQWKRGGGGDLLCAPLSLTHTHTHLCADRRCVIRDSLYNLCFDWALFKRVHACITHDSQNLPHSHPYRLT